MATTADRAVEQCTRQSKPDPKGADRDLGFGQWRQPGNRAWIRRSLGSVKSAVNGFHHGGPDATGGAARATPGKKGPTACTTRRNWHIGIELRRQSENSG